MFQHLVSRKLFFKVHITVLLGFNLHRVTLQVTSQNFAEFCLDKTLQDANYSTAGLTHKTTKLSSEVQGNNAAEFSLQKSPCQKQVTELVTPSICKQMACMQLQLETHQQCLLHLF